MYNKKHLISLLWYLWIGFIWWSISHWFFSWTRSILMALLWIILFTLSEYLLWWIKDYKQLIIWSLVYSIAVWMVSGWFQHFLDSPMRSLRIIPVGWFVSTAIYPYTRNIKNYDFQKSMMIWSLISLILWLILYLSIHILPQEVFVGWDHHWWNNMQNISH